LLRLLQAHAAAAVVNFSEGCESDTMAPHLDALIAKLLTLLQQGKKIVQVCWLAAAAGRCPCMGSCVMIIHVAGSVLPWIAR
jgi:hypothetical protein